MRHTPQSIFGTVLALASVAYTGSPDSLAYHLGRLPYFRSMLEQDCGLPQSQPVEPQPQRGPADENDEFGGVFGGPWIE